MSQGSSIANFFARVGFKVDTKELKKVEEHLNKLSKSFTKTANDFDRASKKMQTALNRTSLGVKPKAQTKKNTKDPNKFSADKLLGSEANIRSMMNLTEGQANSIRRQARALDKLNTSRSVANAKIKESIAAMKRSNKQMEINLRRQNKLNFAHQRAVSSLKQMAGAYASVFTAMQAVGAVKRVGQDLEGARAGMIAVSDGADGLEKDLGFVAKQSIRLGLDLANTTKDFVKLRAVTKGMKDDDLQSIFLGVAEAGTVLQLTAEDQKGALRAVQQMLSKGTVNAEDFRQQLAERLPVAFQALEKATGLSGNALAKAMKDGKLLAKDVLPKLGEELRKVANKNDGLNKILNTSRIAQNRATTAMQNFMDTIFRSGFGDSLTQLFNTITEIFGEVSGLGKGLGKVMSGLTKILTTSIKLLATPLKTISDIFSVLSTHIGETGAAGVMLAAVFSGKLISGLRMVIGVMRKMNKQILMIVGGITLAIASLVEFTALTTKGMVGDIETKFFGGKDLSGSQVLGGSGVPMEKGFFRNAASKLDSISAFGMIKNAVNFLPNLVEGKASGGVTIGKVEVNSNPETLNNLVDDINNQAVIGGL